MSKSRYLGSLVEKEAASVSVKPTSKLLSCINLTAQKFLLFAVECSNVPSILQNQTCTNTLCLRQQKVSLPVLEILSKND